ncbi:MAG: hypothetical protein CMH27_00455 [Micavibrio sp.]|nr:hypothetical protein [Micavibrio sp.]|tara:strand:+ start:1961 stop:2308 length:348 start_codon:yes stop_codon:yes gene_type:complete
MNSLKKFFLSVMHGDWREFDSERMTTKPVDILTDTGATLTYVYDATPLDGDNWSINKYSADISFAGRPAGFLGEIDQAASKEEAIEKLNALETQQNNNMHIYKTPKNHFSYGIDI